MEFYKSASNYIKENSKIYKAYKKNHKLISKYILIIGLIINFIYGVFKLITGIYYKSIWFMTFAAYYLMLCFIKLGLAKNYENSIVKQYEKIKHTGITLLLMNIILFGIIMLIINTNQVFYYPGYLIYIVAIYDFYLIISAFVSVIKYRKHKEPIILASKTVSLTVAMVSMISLEMAMFYTFGNNEVEIRNLITQILGFGVIFTNSFSAIMLIIKSKKVKLFLE